MKNNGKRLSSRIIAVLISILFLLNTSLAYTVTIIIDGMRLQVTRDPGEVVEVLPKLEEIKGWEVESGDVTIVENKFIMPSNDVTIEAIYTQSKYILTVENFGVSGSTLKEVGSEVTVTATSNENYIFTGWSAEGVVLENPTNATITFIMPENDVTLVAEYLTGNTVSWNEPRLGVGMTAVNWNGSDWVDTTEASWDYNYNIATANHGTVVGDGTAKWANARTSDGSMYVWIPRYSYKIVSGEHSDGNSWSADIAGTNKIEVKFSNGITDDTTDGYIAQPAFTFGNDELEGIWVAKYEASRNDATSSSEGSGTIVSSKPGVVSWKNISVSGMYEYSYNLNRRLDSHLMRNSEWGAVAYLTNAVGRIPYINNSSDYITGNSGGSQNASEASGVTNAWNTANGVKASTTHNIYGIYDLSGGAHEYVSVYYTEGNSAYLSGDITNRQYVGTLYANRNTKYVETYTTEYDSSKKGDAVYETSSQAGGNNAWDGDHVNVLMTYSPTFNRGGSSGSASSAGIFRSGCNSGNAQLNIGFRPVLAITEVAEISWNDPILGTGMTAVNWNGSTWVDTTVANWEYNYDMATANHGTVAGDGTAKWANARTSDGSMYVWIPRYSYKVSIGEHSSGNSWSADIAGTNRIEVKFSNGTTDDTTNGYIAHPAFTFGDDELEGIWVAKYEASRNDATSSSEGSGTIVSSKPGVVSWRDISVSQMYEYSYNLNRTLDSHLMRNSEWGAVAYLTNAVGRIPHKNNNSNYITGNAGGSQNATQSEVTNAWNTINGVKASSTHNVYGIYDLSGGANEYVSAYYTGGNSAYLSGDTTNKQYAGALYTNRNTKYVETYTTAYDSTKKGDAIYETSSGVSSEVGYSWDVDYSEVPDFDRPIFLRGAHKGFDIRAGVFAFINSYVRSPSFGFRPVLAIP